MSGNGDNPVRRAVQDLLPGRQQILELNHLQRQGLAGLGVGGNRDAFGKRGSTQTWGRPMLRIPLEDHVELVKRNPLLASKDSKIFSEAWLEFERSDASIPYRTIEDAVHGPRNAVYFGAGGNKPR